MGLSILLADDNNLLIECIKLHFELAYPGSHISLASNIHELNGQLASQHPDIVLLDRHLDGMDMLDPSVLLDRIHARIPIILMTGDDPLALAELPSRIQCVLFKPFDMDEAINCIARVLPTIRRRTVPVIPCKAAPSRQELHHEVANDLAALMGILRLMELEVSSYLETAVPELPAGSAMGLLHVQEIVQRHVSDSMMVAKKINERTKTRPSRPQMVVLPEEDPTPRQIPSRVRNPLDRTVLLVDDDSSVSWSLGRYLTQRGYHIMVCHDGADAIRTLEKRDFSFAILDIQLPQVNGLAVLDWLRRNRPHIIPIAITAYYSNSIQEMCLREGASMFFAKPVDPELIHQVLSSVHAEGKTFSGHSAGLDLLDYVQFLLMTGKTLILELTSADNRLSRLYFQNGSIPHALCNGLQGREAFIEITKTFESGSFITLPYQDPGVISIQENANFLLMDAVRIKDEDARGPGKNEPDFSALDQWT